MAAFANVHRCHAEGCTVETKPDHLMCLPHWRMVPAVLQRTLWRHYRPGQEKGEQPTKAWCLAAERCVVAVAVKEKRLTEEQGEARIAALSKTRISKAA